MSNEEKVQRYSFGEFGPDENNDGDYVKYDDYAAMEQLADDYERLCQSKDATGAEYRGKVADLQVAIAALKEQLAQSERMFMAACEDLGAINEALGLDPNDGGADPILGAIEDLRAAALEEAADHIDGMNDSAGDRAAYDQRDMDMFELDRMHTLSSAAAAIRALASQPAAPVADSAERLRQLDEWVTATGAIGKGGSWYGELQAIVAGKGEPSAAQAAPPVQQPVDVRDLPLTGSDVLSLQAASDWIGQQGGGSIVADIAPVIDKLAALATTRPSAALTEREILKAAAESGIYTKTQMGCTFDPCKLIPFARAILAASGGALAVPELPVVPEGMIKLLNDIADFMARSVNCQQSFDMPPDFSSEFDYNLAQAADELRSIASQLAAPATPAQGQTK